MRTSKSILSCSILLLFPCISEAFHVFSSETQGAVAIQRHLRGFLVRIAIRRHRAAVVIQEML